MGCRQNLKQVPASARRQPHASHHAAAAGAARVDVAAAVLSMGAARSWRRSRGDVCEQVQQHSDGVPLHYVGRRGRQLAVKLCTHTVPHTCHRRDSISEFPCGWHSLLLHHLHSRGRPQHAHHFALYSGSIHNQQRHFGVIACTLNKPRGTAPQ